MSALEAGKTAPAFTLADSAGRIYSLDQLRQGDLLLLAFYHSSCPTCQFAMPFICNLARSVRADKAKIWGVSQDNAATSDQFARRIRLEIPILIDAAPYPVSQAYGLTNVPTLFLIGDNRRILKNCVGFSRLDFLDFGATIARHAAAPQIDPFAGQQVPALRPG